MFVKWIYGVTVYDLFTVTSVNLEFPSFYIPFVSGLIIQSILPKSQKKSTNILRLLAPLALVTLYISYILDDLDLYVYGIFEWKVAIRN